MSVMRAVTGNGNVATICRTVCDAMLDLHLFDRAGFWLVDGEDLCGTWGTDTEGNFTDERGIRQSLTEFMSRFPDLNNPAFQFVINHHAVEVMPCGEERRGFGQAFIPLRNGDDLIALLMVDNLLSMRIVGPQSLEVTLLFCEQVAEAITKTRVLAERESAIAQERRLTELALALASETAPREVLRLAWNAIRDMGTIDRVSLWLVEGLEAKGMWGADSNGEITDEYGATFEIGPADVERLRNKPFEITPNWPTKLPDGTTVPCPHATIPMQSSTQLVGFIFVDTLLTHRAISPSTLKPMVAVALHAAIAVEKMAVQRKVEESLRQKISMMAMAMAVSNSENSSDIYRMLCERAIHEGPFDTAAVWLVEDHSVRGTFRATRGQPTAEIADDSMPISELSNIANIKTSINGYEIDGTARNALIALRSHGELMGLLQLDNTISSRPIGRQDVEAFLPCVELCKIAAEKGYLLRRQERLLVEQQRLTEISSAITAKDNIDDIFAMTRNAISETGIVDRVGLLLLDQDCIWGTYGTDQAGRLTDEHDFRLSLAENPENGYAREVAILSDEARTVVFGQSAVEGVPFPYATFALRSYGKLVGLVRVDNLITGRPLTAESLQPLVPLVQQAAVAIHTSRLLRQANEELAHSQVVEAELRRQAQDLVSARDQALSSTRARDQFIANMSHEMRTPLNGVLGMASLLLHSPLSSQQAGFTRIIQTSASALLSVINAVLDYADLEEGRLTLEARPFNLRQCVEEVVASIDASISQSLIDLACAIPPGFPDSVIGDPGRIRQILMNLVGNAIKFTPQGRVSVTVNCHRQGLTKAQVRFAVADTGIGLAPDQHTEIFAGFSQIDASSTREYGGLGLGLGIAARLAKLMGGKLEVSSELGKGSEFSLDLTLPLAEIPETIETSWLAGRSILVVSPNPTMRVGLSDHLRYWGATVTSAEDLSRNVTNAPDPSLVIFHHAGPADLALRENIRDAFQSPDVPAILVFHPSCWPAEDAGFEGLLPKPCRQSELRSIVSSILKPADNPIEEAHRLRLQDERILLAEDNPVNAVVAQGLLEEWGCVVTWVENGVQALAALQTGTFDIVLMDISMPEIDGLEATRRIRLLDQARGTHQIVIALTAHSATRDRDACFQVGMDDFLTKPIQPDDMLDRLTFWQQKRVKQESATR